MRSSKAQWILLAACLLLSPLAASAATPDDERFWTTVGSAGTLDEESEGKVFFDRAKVQKGKTIGFKQARSQPRTEGDGGVELTDSAVIRYNVTAVDGLFGEIGPLSMTVRFLADGVSAQVIAQLIEVNVETGAKATLLTFDSDAAVVLDGYQVHQVCAREFQFDFVRNAYYIEATLTTSAIDPSSAAGIEVIQVHKTSCTSF